MRAESGTGIILNVDITIRKTDIMIPMNISVTAVDTVQMMTGRGNERSDTWHHVHIRRHEPKIRGP